MAASPTSRSVRGGVGQRPNRFTVSASVAGVPRGAPGRPVNWRIPPEVYDALSERAGDRNVSEVAIAILRRDLLPAARPAPSPVAGLTRAEAFQQANIRPPKSGTFGAKRDKT